MIERRGGHGIPDALRGCGGIEQSDAAAKSGLVVDPEGRTVEWSALKPDMPVTYTYTKEGDRMVVTKVTLAKPLSSYEKTETTTTTTKP